MDPRIFWKSGWRNCFHQVGHGSSAHALFQENPLGGIEYAVAGFLGFLFGFPGH